MTAYPIANYLRDLSPDGQIRKALGGFDTEAERASDLERRMDEARTLGMLEGRAAVQSEYDQRLKQHIEGLEQKFAAERERWARDEAGRLAGLIAKSLDELELRIAEQVAGVLKPLLADEVVRRASAELVANLDKMLINGELGKLTVTGPEDLLEPLRAYLEGKVGNATFLVDERADLSVVADETILETRIGAWLDAIRGDGQ